MQFHWMNVLNFIDNCLLLDICLFENFHYPKWLCIFTFAYLSSCFLWICAYEWIRKYLGLKCLIVNTGGKSVLCTFCTLLMDIKGWGFLQVTGCDVPGFCNSCFQKGKNITLFRKESIYENIPLYADKI